jgi:hypothetical protein
MLTHVGDLGKLLLQRPDMYPYFYLNQQPDEKNTKLKQELEIMAIVFADVLDEASVQSTRFKDQWEDPKSWDKWTEDMLKRSPILREFLKDPKHDGWYGPLLMQRLQKVSP